MLSPPNTPAQSSVSDSSSSAQAQKTRLRINKNNICLNIVKPNRCKVRNINDVIQELNISAIDLMKIDTEGSEYDILSCLNDEILRSIFWITGELHGNRDFELLDYLNSLGFSISFKKLINNRLFMFSAGKKEIISQLSRKEIRIL